MKYKVEVQAAPKGFQVWWNGYDLFMHCPRKGYYMAPQEYEQRYVKGLEDEIRGLIAYVENIADPGGIELDIQFVK